MTLGKRMVVQEAVDQKDGILIRLWEELRHNPAVIIANIALSVPGFLMARFSGQSNQAWTLRQELGVHATRLIIRRPATKVRAISSLSGHRAYWTCGEPLEKIEVNKGAEGSWEGWWIGKPIDPLSGLTILYAHGGGFVMGDALMHARPLSHIIRTLKTQYGIETRILSVEYPLSPEAKYPAALDTMERAYKWLVDVNEAKRVVLGWDATTATSAEALACPDYIGPSHGREYAQHYLGVDPATASSLVTNPFVFPIYGDFTRAGLAKMPMLIVGGGSEIMRYDLEEFAAKMRDEGVRVQLELEPHMVHVYCMLGDFLGEDISRKGLAHIIDFLGRHY
ncbi:hypothetical protein HK104_007205 [Borealophlyctis nickersoniae]|nr:hypothetical protein HK104_007205 [Borealophlyctis nickersoniae]